MKICDGNQSIRTDRIFVKKLLYSFCSKSVTSICTCTTLCSIFYSEVPSFFVCNLFSTKAKFSTYVNPYVPFYLLLYGLFTLRSSVFHFYLCARRNKYQYLNCDVHYFSNLKQFASTSHTI